jgi:hypothetical protein
MGGFDSKTSLSGKLSFYLQEIQNPLSTRPSGGFGLKIFDADDGLQYYYSGTYSITV